MYICMHMLPCNYTYYKASFINQVLLLGWSLLTGNYRLFLWGHLWFPTNKRHQRKGFSTQDYYWSLSWQQDRTIHYKVILCCLTLFISYTYTHNRNHETSKHYSQHSSYIANYCNFIFMFSHRILQLLATYIHMCIKIQIY